MEEANVYFGDDFGQKIDLTVRIREILRNYPGSSIQFVYNLQYVERYDVW